MGYTEEHMNTGGNVCPSSLISHGSCPVSYTHLLREGGEEHPYRLISDSVPNLYNMVTVIAVLRQLGYSHEAISGYMSRAAVVATRHMEEQVGDVKLVRQMSKEKNAPVSYTHLDVYKRQGTC